MRTCDLLFTASSQAEINEAGNKVVTVGRRSHVTWQEAIADGYFNQGTHPRRGQRRGCAYLLARQCLRRLCAGGDLPPSPSPSRATAYSAR